MTPQEAGRHTIECHVLHATALSASTCIARQAAIRLNGPHRVALPRFDPCGHVRADGLPVCAYGAAVRAAVEAGVPPPEHPAIPQPSVLAPGAPDMQWRGALGASGPRVVVEPTSASSHGEVVRQAIKGWWERRRVAAKASGKVCERCGKALQAWTVAAGPPYRCSRHPLSARARAVLAGTRGRRPNTVR